MTAPNPLPPFEHVDRLLRYDPKTGCVYWKVNRGRQARVGQVAGRQEPGRFGYWSIRLRVDGKCRRYRLARIIWLLHYRKEPVGVVDHINCDPSDNRISNLREANYSQSSTNRRAYGQHGVKGVSFDKRAKKSPWSASISLRGQQKHLGKFETKQEAAAAYAGAARLIHGEFARV